MRKIMIKSAKYSVQAAIEHMPAPIRRLYHHYHFRWRFLEQKYQRATAEVEDYFRKFVSNSAPSMKGRTELLSALLQIGITEGLYIIDTLHRCLGVEGDVAEFGVAQGATSALIANEIRNNGKMFWLYDSFKGLPEPSDKDILIHDIANLGNMKAYKGMIAHPAEAVRNRLAEITFPEKRLRIVPGWVEDLSRTGNLPEKVCFAYVDLDLYVPDQDSIGATRPSAPFRGNRSYR
jgi:O-methyltransferase